jgi:DNA adenine methylase
METLDILSQEIAANSVVNVASVPKRSPFRYPGGKTWLIPQIRKWLSSWGHAECELVEPFAGGGIVSLTAVAEGYVRGATLVELDPDIAAVWCTILNGRGHLLADRIVNYELSPEAVQECLSRTHRDKLDHAFATILRNRISRGGILAPGAGVVKNGENGKGLASRWYPHTLQRRILDIVGLKHRLRFVEGDGIEYMRQQAGRPDAVFFIDPPYVGAGRRLYTYSEIDHAELFDVAAELTGSFLMTYDASPEIVSLVTRHGFSVRAVPMKNTHHACKNELLISRNLEWFGPV